jgi:hypothetical protein
MPFLRGILIAKTLKTTLQVIPSRIFWAGEVHRTPSLTMKKLAVEFCNIPNVSMRKGC